VLHYGDGALWSLLTFEACVMAVRRRHEQLTRVTRPLNRVRRNCTVEVIGGGYKRVGRASLDVVNIPVVRCCRMWIHRGLHSQVVLS
jgi:hypothetical protein